MTAGPDASTPRTSVVVCTRDRPEQLRRALASVLAQTDRDLEVVVLDGSIDPVPVVEDARVRVVRQPPVGVGAARAAAVEHSRGRYLAFCDDDDEWAPAHLEVLVTSLDAAGPDIVGVYADSAYGTDDQVLDRAWSQPFDGTLLQACNYVFCSDVLVRTEAVRSVGSFDPSLPQHEDWDLWLRLSVIGSLRHVPATLGTRWWTPGCVSDDVDWELFMQVHQRHQERLSLLGDAVLHDVDVAAAEQRPFDPATWSADRRELLWLSMLRANEGYGSVARQLLPAVAAAGVTVTHAATRNQAPPGFERYFRPVGHWGKVGFYYDYRARPGALPVDVLVDYTMWESTSVPAEQVERINAHAALVYVPCEQNRQAYLDCGVRVPVEVLHHGVDARRFPLLERPERNLLTFGTFGDLALRKGVDVLLRAFCDEFGADEPVRLICKATRSMPAYAVEHPRVELRQGFLDDDALTAMLHEMDAYVLPSRGEGFGLTGLEAMSTGLPLIATDWGGPSEYLDRADSYPLSYRLVETGGALSGTVRYDGAWAEPDYEHLRALLREIVENPGEARRRGLAAAARVHAHWTWDRPARQLVADVDELVG